jgi:hypothetical protein
MPSKGDFGGDCESFAWLGRGLRETPFRSPELAAKPDAGTGVLLAAKSS